MAGMEKIGGAIGFVLTFLFRYLRLIVSIATNVFYKPKPIAAAPTFEPHDATVVVPTTFKCADELVRCLKGIAACLPARIIIVTSNDSLKLVKDCCPRISCRDILVLGVDKLNKRTQMLKALEMVNTAITVFVDDDVFWPDGYLRYLLAIFEDPLAGAGGTRQRAHRKQSTNGWEFLGASYLERRVWNNITTNAIDGSISTLSGRTAAYRSEILQTPEFRHYFANDSWNGQRLNSDDDKCLTRYVYSHGWRIALQSHHHSTIETTLEGDSKYLKQCLRWARAHWRGNLTVMTTETYWRSLKYWWGAYVIYVGQFQTPALLWDGLLVFFLCKLVEGSVHKFYYITALCGWICFTKIVKLIPHFWHHPADLKFLPLSLLFSYAHGVINIYALLTLNVTVWGSQDLQKLERGPVAEVVVLGGGSEEGGVEE